MCGRLTLAATPDEVRRLFGYDDQPNFPPRYNIAPTQPLAIVTNYESRRRFMLVRWGLIPAWAKNPADLPLMINARAETIVDKPSFRGSFRHRRMLVPTTGFYEWKKSATAKKGESQPYFIQPAETTLMAFAGVWETFLGADGSEIDTAAIITLPANGLMRQIHDRMPAVVQPKDFDRWLDCRETSPAEAMALIPPVADDFLEAFPVSTRVNKVVNDDESLIVPQAEGLRSPEAARTELADAIALDLFGEPVRVGKG
jgi:putative SOS response-associated peptidase YedK